MFVQAAPAPQRGFNVNFGNKAKYFVHGKQCETRDGVLFIDGKRTTMKSKMSTLNMVGRDVYINGILFENIPFASDNANKYVI